MREDELHPVEKRPGTKVVTGIREGLAWAAHTPLARVVLGVVTVVSLVGFNFNVLVPLLASQTLDVGAGTFGLLSAAFGLGALAGALATASMREASPRVFVGGAIGFSLAMLGLAFVHSVDVALVLLLLLGMSFSFFTSSANALVQLASPPHLRGRVTSLYLFAFAGLAPIGGLVAASSPSRAGRSSHSASRASPASSRSHGRRTRCSRSLCGPRAPRPDGTAHRCVTVPVGIART